MWPWGPCGRCCPCLTFLVLQPELLLRLLAGEVDVAAELGAVEGLRDVVAAVALEEGQQLLPRALGRQGLHHLGEALEKGEEEEGGEEEEREMEAEGKDRDPVLFVRFAV